MNKYQINWHILHYEPSFRFYGFPPLTFFFNTARTASSKISLRPYWVRALHSRYLHFIYSSIIFLAVYLTIGAFLGSEVYFWYFYLKSILLPTKILTAEGTIYWISGYHWKIEIKKYFFSCIDKRSGIDDRKSDNEDITAGVGERPQTIVLFLPGSVPKLGVDVTKVLDWRFDRRLEEWLQGCRRLWANILWGICFQCSWINKQVPDQDTSFSDSSVTDNHELNSDWFLHYWYVLWIIKLQSQAINSKSIYLLVH